MLGEWKDGKYYVEGLEYTFPKRPPLKDIRNYGLPKKQQVWKRNTDYELYDWDEGWEERIVNNPEQLEFLRTEIEKLTTGEWIFIGGEPVYLNPYMRFFLQWFVLEDTGEYPEYRDTSLYYFRFVEIVDNSKLCTGHTLLKARRLGATSMIAARLLLRAIINKNKNFGITSKTGQDASNAFGFIVNAFQNLPIFLKPYVEGNEAPKKVLSLRKQSGRITKTQTTSGLREGLNNKVFWGSTALNTFDGGAFLDVLVDESGKFPPDVPVRKYLQIVTKCVKKGAKVTGKLSLPTTVNPPSSGGAEYQQVWDNSNQERADYLGQTKSGLYRVMIPSYMGFAGYIDRYGNSVWDTPTQEQSEYLESTGECPDPKIGAKEYLENYRKTLEDDIEALQEEIRMNPFNAKEAFESANTRCMFNLVQANEQIGLLEDKLEDMGKNRTKDELGRRGWFQMMPNGKVGFEDDPEGMWYVAWFPPSNQTNLFRKTKDGGLTPMNMAFGAAGLDPIQSTDATVDKGSDACCMIRRRYREDDEENSGIPVAMFLGRPVDEDFMYRQIYNGLIYYGVMMLAERAPSAFSTYAKRNGLTGYLFMTDRSKGEPVYGIPAQGKDNIDTHVRVQKASFLYDHDKIPFIRLARDRRDFDPNNRTDYDACMADGYALMALEYDYAPPKKLNTSKLRFFKKGSIHTYH